MKVTFLTTLVTAIALGVLLALNPTDRSFFSSIGCMSTSFIGLTSLIIFIVSTLKHRKTQKANRLSLQSLLSTRPQQSDINKHHLINKLTENEESVIHLPPLNSLTDPNLQQNCDDSKNDRDSLFDHKPLKFPPIPPSDFQKPSESSEKQLEQKKQIEEIFEITDPIEIQPLISEEICGQIYNDPKKYLEDFKSVIPSMIESTKEFLKEFLSAYWRSAKKKVHSETLEQIDQQMDEIQKLCFSFIDHLDSNQDILVIMIFKYLNHEKIEDFVSKYNECKKPITNRVFTDNFHDFFNHSCKELESTEYSRALAKDLFLQWIQDHQIDEEQLKNILKLVSENLQLKLRIRQCKPEDSKNSESYEGKIKKNREQIQKSLCQIVQSQKMSADALKQSYENRLKFIALEIEKNLREVLEDRLRNRIHYLSKLYEKHVVQEKKNHNPFLRAGLSLPFVGKLAVDSKVKHWLNKKVIKQFAIDKKIDEPCKKLAEFLAQPVLLKLKKVKNDRQLAQNIKDLYLKESDENGIEEALQPRNTWGKTADLYVSVVNKYTQKMNLLFE
ncbi:MAG: hypothetical protein R3E91_04100 [Chlamydiales bacterium]